MSSLILIAHVKDGVEIARENKLGQVIIDTIRQHHGTSLIKYFFEKAKQRKGEDSVNIDDFRYPGPKPQTREAGLVMLADVVEAASRTLDNFLNWLGKDRKVLRGLIFHLRKDPPGPFRAVYKLRGSFQPEVAGMSLF